MDREQVLFEYLILKRLAFYFVNPAYSMRTKWASHRAEGHVLELGCNAGGLTYLLSKKRQYVVAADNNRVTIKKSRIRLKKYGCNNVDHVVLDAHKLPFQEKTFDTITFIDVLEHLSDPVRALGEAKGVAGKKIIIDVPNYEFLTYTYPNMLPEHFKEPGHFHRTNKGMLLRWLNLANLEQVKLYGSYIPFPIFLIPVSYLIESVCGFVGSGPSRLHFQIKCEVRINGAR